MDDLLLMFLGGVGLPVLTLVVHRYYREYPNQWEDVALSGGLGVLCLAFSAWLLFEIPGGGALVELVAGGVVGVAFPFGFYAVWEAGDSAIRLVQKTRGNEGLETS